MSAVPDVGRLSQDLTALLPALTLRRGIVGVVNETRDDFEQAHYHPGMRVLTINPVESIRYPTRLDLGRLPRTPVIAGLVAHEASHARFSQWLREPAAGIPARVVEWAVLLEEPRIERLGRVALPAAIAETLTASALALVVRDIALDDDPEGAARALALVHGRVVAGVLARDDVAPVIELAAGVLRAHGVNADVIMDAVAHATEAPSAPYAATARAVFDAATRIVEALPKPTGENRRASVSGAPAGAARGSLAEAVRTAAARVGARAVERADALDRIDAAATPPLDGIGTGVGTQGGGAARVRSRRAPDRRDREVARRVREWLAAELQPSVAIVERRGPDGTALDPVLRRHELRLGVRRADRQSWSEPVRRVRAAPPASVCVVLDVSASMASWASPASALAWALASGAADIAPGTRVGFVTFGSGVAVERSWREPPPRWIDVHECREPSTRWTDATRDAIDRAIGHGSDLPGAMSRTRRIVLVSDLHLPPADGAVFARHVGRWTRHGVRVTVTGPPSADRWAGQWDVAELLTPAPRALDLDGATGQAP